MKICTIVGARPQFIKAAVVSVEMIERDVDEDIVHTGQHYDDDMSRIFFDQMGIREPAANLGVGSGTHAGQTGEIMVRLEEYLVDRGPYDGVMVYGDTNSTLAGALVASKLHVPVAHVEAGLRSFNREMPEEINRIIVDRLSSMLYCPSDTAVGHLATEGVTDGVVNVGDVMFDALLHHRQTALSAHPVQNTASDVPGEYYLVTLHRAENTDRRQRLAAMLEILPCVDRPVIWPVHPRTSSRMTEFGLVPGANVKMIPPCGYLPMLSLIDGARAVLTDSGGIQKEALWSRTPCVTLRGETEWVETLEGGWNVLAGADRQTVLDALARPPSGDPPQPYGDGNAASKIVEHLADALSR
jgi:UDP-N-acetylglucosamine 2-epimerase